jgi:predicted DsbA family dithiol-disulfide isomerase
LSVRIDVWSDFVCPFCFIIDFNLERLRETTEVDIHRRAFELRPLGSSIPEYYKQRIEASRPRLAQMIRENYGVEINPGPMEISTRKALVGAKYAETQGKAIGEAYHKQVLRAYWQEGRSIDQIDVLKKAAVQAGLDAAAFEAALANPMYDEAVSMDVDLAHRLGISAVPSMVFGQKVLVSGAQPVEILREAVAEVAGEEQDA